MKAHTRILGLVLSAFCATQLAFAGENLPIKGRFVGGITAAPIVDQPGVFRLVATAAGTASHLGKVRAELVFPEATLNGQLTVGTATWTGTITTANGDQIFGTYTSPGTSFTPALNGDVSYQALLQITGGTGRFANASGQAVATAVANIVTLTFTVQINGTISDVGRRGKP